MITYDKIVETISEIVNNDLIYKKGLTLIYVLDENTHKKLDEHFYYKIKSGETEKTEDNFEHSKEFEVTLGGVLVKFKIDEKEE